jgi:hypothetical protein
MCWPLSWGMVPEPEWCLDDRLTFDWDTVAYVSTDESDRIGRLDQGKVREENRRRVARRSWKGWDDF